MSINYCLKYNCNICCNPVKVHKFFDEEKIPKIWKPRNKLLIPLNAIGIIELKVYDCVLFNKDTWLCNNYNNRPDICKITTCIKDPLKQKDMDSYIKKIKEQIFISIK